MSGSTQLLLTDLLELSLHSLEAGTGLLAVRQTISPKSLDIQFLCQHLQSHLCGLSHLLIHSLLLCQKATVEQVTVQQSTAGLQVFRGMLVQT